MLHPSETLTFMAQLFRVLPVLYQSGQGSIVSGLVDLLVEEAGGFWIINHNGNRCRANGITGFEQPETMEESNAIF